MRLGLRKWPADFVEFLEESFSKLSIGTHLGKYKMAWTYTCRFRDSFEYQGNRMLHLNTCNLAEGGANHADLTHRTALKAT